MMRDSAITPRTSAAFPNIFTEDRILFDDSKRYFVDRRLVERINATGSADCAAYLKLLRLDLTGREAQILTNAMTVNETYFFREAYQFACLTESLLPEIVRVKRSARPIRILTMPCSTGEDAYTIAIQIMEHWGDIDKYDVEILAADIDTDVLASAQRGVYSARSLQGVPPAVLNGISRRAATASGRFAQSCATASNSSAATWSIAPKWPASRTST